MTKKQKQCLAAFLGLLFFIGSMIAIWYNFQLGSKIVYSVAILTLLLVFILTIEIEKD